MHEIAAKAVNIDARLFGIGIGIAEYQRIQFRTHSPW